MVKKVNCFFKIYIFTRARELFAAALRGADGIGAAGGAAREREAPSSCGAARKITKSGRLLGAFSPVSTKRKKLFIFFEKTLDKSRRVCYNTQVAEIWVWRSW